jgi:hypothetical protein
LAEGLKGGLRLGFMCQAFSASRSAWRLSGPNKAGARGLSNPPAAA